MATRKPSHRDEMIRAARREAVRAGVGMVQCTVNAGAIAQKDEVERRAAEESIGETG